MKYIGNVKNFNKSKGFGFIISNQLIAEGYSKDVFFHISNCSFTPNTDDCIIFELNKSKGKVQAIQVKLLYQEIDYILNNWLRYSTNEKNVCYSEFEKWFRIDASFREKVIKISKSDIIFEDLKLEKWVNSINERFLIESISFFDGCIKIVEDIVSQSINDDYSYVNDFLLQELPSYDEIYQSVVDFVNNVKPSIIYTHKTIEGYWKTRCKWDSCEEYYVDGKEFSNFESKNCLSFKDDTIDINFHTAGSGNYEQDIQRKYDFIFSVCSFLKNKTFVWHKIISHYSKRRHDILQHLINDAANKVCKSLQPNILSALSKYMHTIFPVLGETFYKYIEMQYFNPTIQHEEEQKVIDEIRKFNVIGSIKVDYKVLFRKLKWVAQYVFSCSEREIVKRAEIKTPLSFYEYHTIEDDGLLMSMDRTHLYRVINRNLQEVIIPQTITYIEDDAFCGCNNLTIVRFLGSIVYIGHNVFSDKQLEINGDFTNLKYVGFNNNVSNLKMSNEIRSIREWSYLFNKYTIENAEFTIIK